MWAPNPRSARPFPSFVFLSFVFLSCFFFPLLAFFLLLSSPCFLLSFFFFFSLSSTLLPFFLSIFLFADRAQGARSFNGGPNAAPILAEGGAESRNTGFPGKSAAFLGEGNRKSARANFDWHCQFWAPGLKFPLRFSAPSRRRFYRRPPVAGRLRKEERR